MRLFSYLPFLSRFINSLFFPTLARAKVTCQITFVTTHPVMQLIYPVALDPRVNAEPRPHLDIAALAAVPHV